MNMDLDKQLQDLLSKHTEQPTADCWDKISSHLDAMQAINAGSAAANGSQISQFVGSVVGKIAVAVTVAASVAVATYFVLTNDDENTQIAQQQKDDFTQEETIATLPTQYMHDETMENKVEKPTPSHDISQTAPVFLTDTVTDKKVEENRTVFSPAINIADNQTTTNISAKESFPQLKEARQPQHALPMKNESIAKLANGIELKVGVEEAKSNVEDIEEAEDPKHPKILIPNVFTPNGDDVNDYFEIIGLEQVEETQLDVFTRVGKVVYSKRFYDNKWNGGGLPDGTYFYVFRYIYEGNQFFRRGSISIRR